MTDFLTSKAAVILCIFIIVISRLFVALVVYINCKDKDKYLRTVLALLSIAFPIITGIVSAVECKKKPKKVVSIIISLIIYFAVSVSVTAVLSYNLSYNQSEKYYDREGNEYFNPFSVTFQDVDGNKYAYNFDKSGYDYLYINGTQERLDTDICYVGTDGYLYYDDDMSIVVKDSTCCVDEDGSLYYPARFTAFNKDGSVNRSVSMNNLSYDRFGNAYTYDYVPYYDRDLNKYRYSFDSNTQKGSYTNVNTGEVLENEYCFVDQNGYLVYDKEHTFTGEKNEDGFEIYTAPDGETYYWASSIFWDKDGNLLDSFGKVIDMD